MLLGLQQEYKEGVDMGTEVHLICGRGRGRASTRQGYGEASAASKGMPAKWHAGMFRHL